jgi:hypothetical protein
MNIEGQIHRQRKAAQRPIGVGSNPKSSRIPGEFIEYHHRPIFLRGEFGETADVHFQVGVFHMQDFTDLVRGFNEFIH